MIHQLVCHLNTPRHWEYLYYPHFGDDDLMTESLNCLPKEMQNVLGEQ